MIRRRGMGRRAGWEGGLFGSRLGVSAGVIVTQVKRSGWMLVSGPDGSVHMPPCLRVESLMPRKQGQKAGGGKQEAGTPGSFRNRGRASACTAGGQTAADLRRYRSTTTVQPTVHPHWRGLHNDSHWQVQLITGGRGLSRPGDWRRGAS